MGIDLVGRDEVQEALARHASRYLARVYTEREVQDAGGSALRLAACFAAKEAAMKALRRDDEPLSWRDIAVGRDADGRPALALSGAAQRLAASRHVVSLSLSLSRHGDSAAAIVLARTAR